MDSLPEDKLKILNAEFENGRQRICLMDLILIIGKDIEYRYCGCVYGYKPEHLVKQDEQLLKMITTRMSDPTKSVGKTALKHNGRITIKIKQVIYTRMTHGYKKL